MHGACDDAILDVEVTDSLGVANRLLGDVAALGELELNTVEADAMQLGQVGHLDQPPRADDPDLIADVLDLGEDVRREEDRGAAVALLAQQSVELLLVERFEPAA